MKNSRGATARAMRSVGVAVLAVIGALVIGLASTISSAAQLLTNVLIMTGTFTPTPDHQYMDMAVKQFIVPSIGGDYPQSTWVPITTPEQAWPITGLTDYPFGVSVRIGWQDFQQAMQQQEQAQPGEPYVVFGYSQSSVISILEKRKLEAEKARGQQTPDITFVLTGVLNRPNGGVMTRFWGGYIPLIDFYFNGPAPTDPQYGFQTVDIARQWDGFADFPVYPLNALATMNAFLGMVYTHTGYDQVTLNTSSPNYNPDTVVQQKGDTTYYWIPTKDLPLFGPLRSLGVPESLIDIVEPVAKVIVEWGYDRSIPFGEPTPARLLPPLDRAAVVNGIGDLFSAVNDGFNNALIAFGVRPAITVPAPQSPAPAQTGSTNNTLAAAETTAAPTRQAQPEATPAPDPAPRTSTTPNPGKAADGSGATEPTPNPSRTSRPELRGPNGFFGPRIRDAFHRGHLPTSAGATTEDRADAPQQGRTPAAGGETSGSTTTGGSASSAGASGSAASSGADGS